MRLHRLELRRYGHLSDVVLDFPAEAALCVVHGVNEAGKSTALAAIADALFGFQDLRTGLRPDFLHGGQQLRIAVTLAMRDGTQASLVRRKGRTNTLTDEAGQSVPEAVMQRILGGAGRDAWRDTFGLNGERLREGGRALAAGGGTVGETLFSAATGLLHHRAALERLEDAARKLVGRANADRVFNVSMERWRAAQRDMERHSVQPRAWIEADAQHAQAVADLARLQAEVDDLRREESQLQRIRRVAPVLAQMDAARGTVTRLAGAPHLPPDAEERLKADRVESDKALLDRAQATQRADSLVKKRDALRRSPALIAAQDEVGRLTELRGAVVQAEADRPAIVLEANTLRDRVIEAAAALGRSSPEAARDALPSIVARGKVPPLAKKHAVLVKTTADAQRSCTEAAAALDVARRDLAATPTPAAPGPLRHTLDAARQEGRLDAELAGKTAIAMAAGEAANVGLAALPRWTGKLEDLASCKLPLPADEAACAATLTDAAGQVTQAETALARASDEVGEAEAFLTSFGPAAALPTPDSVQESRAIRDAVWREVRDVLVGGPPARAPLTLADGFEQAQADADRLADRRADEAQRVSDYLSAVQRMEAARHEQAACTNRLEALNAARRGADAKWRTLWSQATAEPGSPSVMAEWRRARSVVLDAVDKATKAGAERDETARRRAEAVGSIRHLLPELQEGISLGRAIAEGAAELEIREAAAAAHQLRMDAPRLAQAALDKAELARREAEDAEVRWRREWNPAVAALGLPPDCPVEVAEAAVAAWTTVDKNAGPWRTAELRAEQMRRTIEKFGGMVATLLPAGSPHPAEEPALVAAARFERELLEAKAVEAEHVSLSQRIDEHRREAAEAEASHDRAAARIESMQRGVGAKDLPALETAIAQARELRDAEKAAADLTAKLLTEGDGYDEASLREAAAAYDPDAAPARLATIGGRLKELDASRESLAEARTRHASDLATMHEAGAAADSAQDARHALAEATHAAERYGRLLVARELLRAGMARFRQGQQGPLLDAAGRHFAALTAGRYARLSVDEDKDGRMLLIAVRDDGSECPVGALSEGTQDQLFLALRIAMVEAHAATAEPLPFIADDLLVHFDDTRAAAAIRLLTVLGRTTQVILFSHHDHVAALAARMGAPDVAVIGLPAIDPVSRSSTLSQATV